MEEMSKSWAPILVFNLALGVTIAAPHSRQNSTVAFLKTLAIKSNSFIQHEKIIQAQATPFRDKHAKGRQRRDSWRMLPRDTTLLSSSQEVDTTSRMFSETSNATQIKKERNVINTTEFSTMISTMEEILGLIPSPKERRASTMLCSLEKADAPAAQNTTTSKSLLRCRLTAINLHSIVFEDAECDGAECQRVLRDY